MRGPGLGGPFELFIYNIRVQATVVITESRAGSSRARTGTEEAAAATVLTNEGWDHSATLFSTIYFEDHYAGLIK